MPPRRRGPRPPPRSTGKESTPAAPIAIAAVTDERRLPMSLRGRPDPTGSISTPLRMNIGLDDLDPEREPLQQVVEELDGGLLVATVIDAQHAEPGAVVDGGELVVLAP